MDDAGGTCTGVVSQKIASLGMPIMVRMAPTRLLVSFNWFKGLPIVNLIKIGQKQWTVGT